MILMLLILGLSHCFGLRLSMTVAILGECLPTSLYKWFVLPGHRPQPRQSCQEYGVWFLLTQAGTGVSDFFLAVINISRPRVALYQQKVWNRRKTAASVLNSEMSSVQILPWLLIPGPWSQSAWKLSAYIQLKSSLCSNVGRNFIVNSEQCCSGSETNIFWSPKWHRFKALNKQI